MRVRKVGRAREKVGAFALSLVVAGCVSQDPQPQEYGLGAADRVVTGALSLEGQTGAAAPKGGEDFASSAGNLVYFTRGSAELSGAARATLRRQIRWIKSHPPARVVVEGHADEWGTRQDNLALGAARAMAVKGFLQRHGLRGVRVDTVSYGKERLVADCVASACRAKNRRTRTVLKSPQS